MPKKRSSIDEGHRNHPRNHNGPVDRTEPSVSAPDDIELKILRVGICGTDRAQTAGGRALAPTGHKDLIIGREMFGQVTEVGKSVTRVQKGDYAVFTVRRGCGKCMPCAHEPFGHVQEGRVC